VLRHVQERMPYGLFVPDVQCGTSGAPTCLLALIITVARKGSATPL
jgi:hypothetical protein